MIGGKYFALVVILFLNLFAIVIQGFRINFLGELLVFILFLIASMIILALVYKERGYGIFTSVFFLISLINLIYIGKSFAVNPEVNAGTRGWLLFGINSLLNATGFLIGAYSIKKGMSEKEKEEIIEKEIEPKLREAEKKLESDLSHTNLHDENTFAAEDEKVEPWPSVTESFYPGKYLASIRGAVYHVPKCDWAKKISKKSRIWFKSDEEARKKGYKKHSCLKN